MKRVKLYKKVKQKHIDVIMLQETQWCHQCCWVGETVEGAANFKSQLVINLVVGLLLLFAHNFIPSSYTGEEF